MELAGDGEQPGSECLGDSALIRHKFTHVSRKRCFIVTASDREVMLQLNWEAEHACYRIDAANDAAEHDSEELCAL